MPAFPPNEGDWWFLSYADDDGFRGGVVVGPAHDFISACLLSAQRGINPGGEVLGGCFSLDPPPEKYRFTLMNKATVEEMDALMCGRKAD